MPVRCRPSPHPRSDRRLDAWIAPVRANLSWSSAILRHAVRAAVLTVAGGGGLADLVERLFALAHHHGGADDAALFRRDLAAGAGAGRRDGAGRADRRRAGLLPADRAGRSLLLVPLSVIGFSVRQVSYGAYMACLTPFVVVLFDVAEPGHAEWLIAAMRTLYTIGGRRRRGGGLHACCGRAGSPTAPRRGCATR